MLRETPGSILPVLPIYHETYSAITRWAQGAGTRHPLLFAWGLEPEFLSNVSEGTSLPRQDFSEGTPVLPGRCAVDVGTGFGRR